MDVESRKIIKSSLLAGSWANLAKKCLIIGQLLVLIGCQFLGMLAKLPLLVIVYLSEWYN